MRSSNGCWTCRLRRKKCDENHPICGTCAALSIACHFDLDHRPEWMDGGIKQDEMAEQLKREIKEKAHHRRGERVVGVPSDQASGSEASTGGFPSQAPRRDPTTPTFGYSNVALEIHNGTSDQSLPMSNLFRPQRGADCTIISKEGREDIAFGRSDAILLAFYLEHLLPFLFPFYRPSFLEGGRSWIFELMISSPVVRQAILCQSSYFLSSAQGMSNRHEVWDGMLAQTTHTFGVLRQALQVIDGSKIAEHLHGTVRIMASIMQMHRFEIAVSIFDTWQTHLNAALALLIQLLDSAAELGDPRSRFEAVLSHLGPTLSSWRCPRSACQMQSAEQSAFSFSSTLILFDDIVASTVLQEQPRLYDYHRSLLGGVEGTGNPPINVEAVVGLKSCILLEIGEISTLEAWKRRCGAAGSLDVIELVHRAAAIKEVLAAHLIRLEVDPPTSPTQQYSLLDSVNPIPCQSSLISRVWAHAALIYLSIVVSGWQPANTDVRHHVSRIIELLEWQRAPVFLRTIVWPFCIAGCFAEPAQESHFRGMVEVLQPSDLFGPVHKALEVMKTVWASRDTNIADRDISTCFRVQEELVLLV